MISIGDVTVGKSSEITISPATASLNNFANNIKTFLNEPGLGQWINDRIDNITHHRITTELYGAYDNTAVLENDSQTNGIDLHDLSGNLYDFKENPNYKYYNPNYFQEINNNSTKDSNPTFPNINFNSSEITYIGFNGFSGGCTK